MFYESVISLFRIPLSHIRNILVKFDRRIVHPVYSTIFRETQPTLTSQFVEELLRFIYDS